MILSKLISTVFIFVGAFIKKQMTTRYTVKRCSTFGFAQSLHDALGLFQSDENSDIIYLRESAPCITTPRYDKFLEKLNTLDRFKEIHSINELAPSSKSSIIVVDLGVRKSKIIKEPIAYDDTNIINTYFESYQTDDIKSAFIKLQTDQSLFCEKKLSNDILSHMIDIYPLLRDYNLKTVILEILNYNDYNTIDLEKHYPFEYKDKEIEYIASASEFSDIEISIDKNDKNTSTSMYRADKDALKKATLGRTTQLDAFSENKFAIIHTKKKAGIESKIRNQNHDVLDTLAINGVMKSPDTKVPLSIYRLVKQLEQFTNFNIVFIHPSYEIKSMNAEYPCEQIIPAYKINEGEILAVVYRYIVVYFFGYCSIFTDSMLEWRYYI